jgi:hypothetical protein
VAPSDIVRRLLSILAVLALTMASLAVSATLATAASAAAGGPTAQQAGDEEEPGDDDFDEDFDDEEEPFLDDEVVDEQADELVPLERATTELGRAKRSAARGIARLSSATALRPCLRGGPGWKRIRAVRHAPQRVLYTASARRLLADMRLLLDGQRPRIVALEPAFERFVAQLRSAGVSTPVLRDAVAAHARRLAAYRGLRSVKASCRVFNRLTKRVREFPTRSAAQIVRADYRTAPIARRIERHVSNQLKAIDRRNGITYRDADVLAEAAETIVDLGGSQGFATGFQYALSLR